MKRQHRLFVFRLIANYAHRIQLTSKLTRALAGLSASSIQNVHNLLTFVARTADRNRQHQDQHVPRTHHCQLSRRSDDRRLRHHKAPHFLESLTKRDILTGIQSLGKSASRSVRLPRAKEETASRPSDERASTTPVEWNIRPQSGIGPSNLNTHPPPAAPERRTARAAPTARSLTCVSASTKKNNSPPAARAPALRTAEILRYSTRIVRAPICSAIRRVESAD